MDAIDQGTQGTQGTVGTGVDPNAAGMVQADVIQEQYPNTFEAFQKLSPDSDPNMIATEIAHYAKNVPGFTDDQGTQLAEHLGSGAGDEMMQQELLKGAGQMVANGQAEDIPSAMSQMMNNLPSHYKNSLMGGNGQVQPEENAPTTVGPTLGQNGPSVPDENTPPEGAPPGAPTLDDVKTALANRLPNADPKQINAMAQQMYQKFADSMKGNGVNTMGQLLGAQSANNTNIAIQNLAGSRANINPVQDLQQQQQLIQNNANNAQSLTGMAAQADLRSQSMDPNSLLSGVLSKSLVSAYPDLAKTIIPGQTSAYQILQIFPKADPMQLTQFAQMEQMFGANGGNPGAQSTIQKAILANLMGNKDLADTILKDPSLAQATAAATKSGENQAATEENLMNYNSRLGPMMSTLDNLDKLNATTPSGKEAEYAGTIAANTGNLPGGPYMSGKAANVASFDAQGKQVLLNEIQGLLTDAKSSGASVRLTDQLTDILHQANGIDVNGSQAERAAQISAVRQSLKNLQGIAESKSNIANKGAPNEPTSPQKQTATGPTKTVTIGGKSVTYAKGNDGQWHLQKGE